MRIQTATGMVIDEQNGEVGSWMIEVTQFSCD